MAQPPLLGQGGESAPLLLRRCYVCPSVRAKEGNTLLARPHGVKRVEGSVSEEGNPRFPILLAMREKMGPWALRATPDNEKVGI